MVVVVGNDLLVELIRHHTVWKITICLASRLCTSEQLDHAIELHLWSILQFSAAILRNPPVGRRTRQLSCGVTESKAEGTSE